MKKQITVKKDNGDKLVINIAIRETNHSYFSITADLYEGRKLVSCGCLHDEILAARPDLKLLVDLHLSDVDGVPMHSIENGWYYFTNPNKYGKNVVMDHLRIDEETYNKLDKEIRETPKVGKNVFIVFCAKQHDRWLKEAEKAKEFINSL